MTHKQRELLIFIERYLAQHDGVSPSFEEMARGIRLASKGGIHRLLTALEEQQRIRRTPNRQRCIEIVSAARDLSHLSDTDIAAEYHRRFPSRLEFSGFAEARA